MESLAIRGSAFPEMWRKLESWKRELPGYLLAVREEINGFTAEVFHVPSGRLARESYRTADIAKLAALEAFRRHRTDPEGDDLFPEAVDIASAA